MRGSCAAAAVLTYGRRFEVGAGRSGELAESPPEWRRSRARTPTVIDPGVRAAAAQDAAASAVTVWTLRTAPSPSKSVGLRV